MEEVLIERVTADDMEALQDIGRRTFLETFADANTQENMESYLVYSFAMDKLIEELQHPNTKFFFAILGEKIVGYLKINSGSAQTEMQENNAVEMERIYVLQEYQGREIGQLLYNHAVKEANLLDANYIWLGVWEENKRAISFYEKNGFIAFDKHVFKLGEDEQIDIMMKKML